MKKSMLIVRWGTPYGELCTKYHQKKMESDEGTKNQNEHHWGYITLVFSVLWLRALSSCKIIVALGSISPRLPLDPGLPTVILVSTSETLCWVLVHWEVKGCNGFSWRWAMQKYWRSRDKLTHLLMVCHSWNVVRGSLQRMNVYTLLYVALNFFFYYFF